MRRKRAKKTIFLFLTLIICVAGMLAMAAVAPKGETLLQTAAWAGSFFASPRTALTGDGAGLGGRAPDEEQSGSTGGFWMQLPAQQTQQEQPQQAQTQETPPEGAVPVEETTYTGTVGGIYLAAGAGILKNMTSLPAAEVAAEIGQPRPFRSRPVPPSRRC